MKFLSVLCVVLYLQCGASVRGHNNDPTVQNPIQTSKLMVQRKIDTPLNFAPGNPSEMNWQREEGKQRNYPINRDRQFISQESSTYGSIRNFPEYGNFQQVKNINDLPANRESSIRLLQELRQAQNPSNINSYHNPRGSFINDKREIQKQPLISSGLIETVQSSEYNNHQSVENVALESKQQKAGLRLDSSYTNAQPLQVLNHPSLRSKYDVPEDLSESRLHYSEYLRSQPIQMVKPPLRLEEDMLTTVDVASHRPINSKSISHGPEEEIRLELQGVSPEYIQSLINKNIPVEKRILQNSFQNTNEPEGLKGLYNHNYIKKSQLDNEPKSQNPSAEILYKMKKALPYEIQLSNEEISRLNYIPHQVVSKTGAPGKRFTIIHPDGRIEHVDQIETFIENNPNYVMVNSKDILKRLEENSNTFTRTLIPRLNQYAHSIMNQAQNEENYNLPSRDNQNLPIIKKPVKSTVDDRLITIPENKVMTFTNNLNNIAPLKPTSEINMSENNPLASLILNNATPDTAQQNITQNNILSQSSHNITVGSSPTPLTFLESPKTDYVTDKPIFNNSIPDLKITDNKSRPTLNTTEVAIKQLSSHQNINQTLSIVADLSNSQTLPVTLSTTQQEYITNETTANNQTTTTPTSISNASFKNESETNIVNNSNTDLKTSAINETSTDFNSAQNSTGFWFQADEHFWESLLSRDGTENKFYFLFVPPKPNTEKETRTTIYPNGTAIEEVVETVNKDGESKIFRTTKITYANSTSGIE